MTEPVEDGGGGAEADAPSAEIAEPRAGASPYATGGGGVTFERRVAVQYLSRLLTGEGASELGDGRSIDSVSFQQAPLHPVDDLVVRARRAEEPEPSLVLAIGVRRAPDLVQSDEPTQKLIREFVRAVINTPTDGPEHRLALVVAGVQPHAQQLADLAALSAVQMDASAFFDLVRTPKRFTVDLRSRLDQIEKLVKQALIELGSPDPDTAFVRHRTWELLARLTVLMPRLEAPDETDWATVENNLIRVARGCDLAGASRLRDRLVALADGYPPKAATVDLRLLRRDAHALLDATVRRHEQGELALGHLHERAVASVRDDIAASDGVRRVHIDRRNAAAKLLANAAEASSVVVYGESGVGKSALAVLSLVAAAVADPDAMQARCVNLRQLPATTLALEAILGCPLVALLGELSAPQRLLIIDNADAVAEGMGDMLGYLVDSARESEVRVIAVTAAENKQVVRDAISRSCGADVTEYPVAGLTDAEIDEVVATFAELSNLAASPRSRELLRRPVVIDLLVRGRVSGVPLNDADAMGEVWSGLVRRHEQSDRGAPDAREVALLRLADLALSGGDALGVIGAIDPLALDGLCQALLALPDSANAPLHGRFAALQVAFDALVEAGHGERWGDVPGEALLTLSEPDPVLSDAWPSLRTDDAAGLKRLARLVDQRLRDQNAIVSILAVEPIVSLLLDDETPWWSGDYAQTPLRDWLRAHIVGDTPVGHPLRVRLRERLVAASAAADGRLTGERQAAAAASAARSPEEIEDERQLMESRRWLFTEIGYPRSRRRRERPELPREITDKIVMELLALLGPDLGDDGEAILRRVAQDAPSWLAPAVEELLAGRALATYRRGFLAELTEAYYIDDESEGTGLGKPMPFAVQSFAGSASGSSRMRRASSRRG